MDVYKVGNYTLKLVEGDITLLDVDAIVNAANTHLVLGAGVAGAIRRRGGPSIQKECDEYVKKHGPIRTGEVFVSGGGNLKAKYVIHAAGPIYNRYSPEEADRLLESAVRNPLRKMEELGLGSIAFPAISAGIYGFPPQRCAEVILSTIIDYMKKKNAEGGKGAEIIVCLYGNEMFNLFADTLEKLVRNMVTESRT